jgi:hypothetical protein
MCDPVSMVTLAGAAISAGAGIYEGQQAQAGLAATQQAQQSANDQWVAYQTRIHNQQAADEDAARSKATAAQQDTLNKVSPQAQAATQATEQDRLNSLYTRPGASTAAGPGGPGASLLSGESSGNQTFMDSLTQQVNQATAAARKRIGALATASSYGGSFGGLGTTTPIIFAQGGNDINLQNAIRQGNLKTYGVEQQVQPVNYVVGPGTTAQATLAKTLGSVAGSLAGVGGPRALGDLSRGASVGIGAGFNAANPNLDWSAAAGDWSGIAPGMSV